MVKQRKVSKTISLDADIWFKLDNIIAPRWRLDRSGIVKRIVLEWLENNPEMLAGNGDNQPQLPGIG